MSNAISVTPFSPSSAAASSSASLASASSAPSTGLGARTPTPVPVQQQVRDLKSEKTGASDASPSVRAAQRRALLARVYDSDLDLSLARLSTTRDELRANALAMGHPRDEVEAWLAEERTTIDLLSKNSLWMDQLDDSEWTVGLARYCAYHLGAYLAIPEEFRSDSLVQLNMRAFTIRLSQELTKDRQARKVESKCCLIS